MKKLTLAGAVYKKGCINYDYTEICEIDENNLEEIINRAIDFIESEQNFVGKVFEFQVYDRKEIEETGLYKGIIFYGKMDCGKPCLDSNTIIEDVKKEFYEI